MCVQAWHSVSGFELKHGLELSSPELDFKIWGKYLYNPQNLRDLYPLFSALQKF